MKVAPKFVTEAELVAAFCAALAPKRQYARKSWTVYHETAGFDLLLVEDATGVQVGIEAKLSLNLKVLEQALPNYAWQHSGPDYRGVLVPLRGVQHFLPDLARRLGIGIIQISGDGYEFPNLPDETNLWSENSDWHPWLPAARCALPDYIPDVTGGHPAPLQLTHWKIRAIKLLILLDRQGFLTRSDMKFMQISPTAWTQPGGYLGRADGRYVRCARTPDFRRQHPQNYQQIEDDFAKWAPPPSLKQSTLGAVA